MKQEKHKSEPKRWTAGEIIDFNHIQQSKIVFRESHDYSLRRFVEAEEYDKAVANLLLLKKHISELSKQLIAERAAYAGQERRHKSLMRELESKLKKVKG